ncbi:MAG TPA: hypothetical protein DHU71_11405, partial [Erythrobacter sp.]|nr:hypothetical protein [Erythrobacter sp.]
SRTTGPSNSADSTVARWTTIGKLIPRDVCMASCDPNPPNTIDIPVMTTVAAIVIAAVDRIEGGFAAPVVVSFGLLRLAVLGMVMFRR